MAGGRLQRPGGRQRPRGAGHDGVTDLYTKIEFDPWGDALGESLSGFGISWSLVLVEYEEDTGFYHWSWDWEVVC